MIAGSAEARAAGPEGQPASAAGESRRISEVYARFRGSRKFLVALSLVIAFWVGWNLAPGVPHFDTPGFDRLNLFLSTEASLSVALLIMAGEKNDAMQRKQLLYMMHLLEGQRDALAMALARATDPDAGAGVAASQPAAEGN